MKHIILPVVMIFTATAFADTVGDKQLTAKAYVDNTLNLKQDKIPAAGKPGVTVGDTVMTYTPGGNGVIGERRLYSDASIYNATTDGDKLITASALNDTFHSLPTVETSTMICANSPTCTLWTITDDTAYTASCAADQIDVGGGMANCQTAKFTVTTTNMAANTDFKFYISASGTFYVDCGADGTLSGTGVVGNTITRTDTIDTIYTCTYSTGGAKTIRFGGRATGYGTASAIKFYISSSSPTCKVAAINGSLGAIFPTLGQTETQTPRFIDTFYTCGQLTTIPENLFNGVTGTRTSMFWATFMKSGVTSIPENLFSGITGCAYQTFYQTFQYTHITSIPNNLFKNITNAAEKCFYFTFEGCQNLSGYIPPSTFAGLIANGHPTATDMWKDTFGGTQLVRTCPTGTTQYTTGYESSWAGKVSCIPN